MSNDAEDKAVAEGSNEAVAMDVEDEGTTPPEKASKRSKEELAAQKEGDSLDDEAPSQEASAEPDALECREILSSSPASVNDENDEKSASKPVASPAVTRNMRLQPRALPSAASGRKMTTRGRRLDVKDMLDDYDDERPRRKRRKYRRRRDSDSESSEEPEIFLSSSANLSYSWDALKLGEELGSAALNRFMARHSPSGDAPELTAQQTLQVVNSLRLKTILPPAESPLHKIIQTNRFENQSLLYGPDNEEIENDVFYSPSSAATDNTKYRWLPYLQSSDDDEGMSHLSPRARIPYKTFARLYESMCEQDVDDGAANRREVQYLSTAACVERLKSFENEACALKLREQKVMAKAKELDLIDVQQVSSLLGYRRAQDEESPKKPGLFET